MNAPSPKGEVFHCFSKEEGTATLLQFVELQPFPSFVLSPSTLEKVHLANQLFL